MDNEHKTMTSATSSLKPQGGNDSDILESMPGLSQLENPSPLIPKLSSPQSEPQRKSAKSRRGQSKKKTNTNVLRRSQRLKFAVVHTSNQDITPVYEDLTLFSDNEGDEQDSDEPDWDEPVRNETVPEVDKDTPLPESEANSTQQRFEEKVDCLLQRFQALEKLIETLQSKVHENIGLNEAPSSASFTSRRMYIDCQKKIEALTKENLQLTGQLQLASGKVAVYEKASQIFAQAVDKMKDAILISSLATITEAAVNGSASGAKKTTHADGTAKRKKKR